MRVAVIGIGGIGGPYGASLAKAGADVTFVARGAHLRAMQKDGLRLEGDRGEILVRPAQATDDIAGIGAVDYVLLCVKLWDVESAGEQIRPITGPATAVVPLQNGVDAAERLIPILGRAAVMGATAFVTGSIVAPGVVRQTGTYQQMTFGDLDGGASPRGERLRDLCAAAITVNPASRNTAAITARSPPSSPTTRIVGRVPAMASFASLPVSPTSLSTES